MILLFSYGDYNNLGTESEKQGEMATIDSCTSKENLSYCKKKMLAKFRGLKSRDIYYVPITGQCSGSGRKFCST